MYVYTQNTIILRTHIDTHQLQMRIKIIIVYTFILEVGLYLNE